jgi:hypothetical protein
MARGDGYADAYDTRTPSGAPSSDPRCGEAPLEVVRAIVNGGNKIKTGQTHVGDRATPIVGANPNRRRLRIMAERDNSVIYVGDQNVANAGQSRGWPTYGPIPPGIGSSGRWASIFETVTQAEIWAIAPPGTVVAVAFIDEYAIKEIGSEK